MSKILVIDFAASEGGALSVLNDYYNKIKNDKYNQYLFLLNDYYLKDSDNVKVFVLKKYKNRFMRLYFDYFYGRKFVKKVDPDEILSLQNTVIRGTKKKQYVFIHQSIPFQNLKKFSFFKKTEFKYAIIQFLIGNCIIKSAKIADKVFVQTRWMKNAVINKCGISEDKVIVKKPEISFNYKLTNDLEKVFKDNIARFFYPTSNYIYKNNELIVDCALALIKEGITNFEVQLTLDGESTTNIKRIGKISRVEVFNKYSNSILLFPSYIETFGLPLLEAKKCNCIILASDTAFSHEVLDDYDKAYFFDPFDVFELKNLMKNIISKGEKK